MEQIAHLHIEKLPEGTLRAIFGPDRGRLAACFFAGILLLSVGVYADDSIRTEAIGSWEGALEVQGITFPVVFHITEDEGELSATMDSSRQNVFGLATTALIRNGGLILIQKQSGIFYRGKLVDGTIVGEFAQGGETYNLVLVRSSPEPSDDDKAGDSTGASLPYTEEEVRFANPRGGHRLSGTLSYMPTTGERPAVILLSGSGQQNRDHAMFGHKPFRTIADRFSRAGFAVLRFDDRGIGKSEGDYVNATSLDFSTDALAAAAFLRRREQIDGSRVGMLGHSEGGIIAQLAASQDAEIAFLVLLSSPGVDGATVYGTQLHTFAGRQADTELPGLDRFLAYSHAARDDVASEKFESLFYELNPDASKEQFRSTRKVLSTNWFQYFLSFDSASVLSELRIPILAVHGGKDKQIEPSANLLAIDSALAESAHPDYEVKQFAGLNHLLQTAETGWPDEYGAIGESIAPDVLDYVTTWLSERFL